MILSWKIYCLFLMIFTLLSTPTGANEEDYATLRTLKTSWGGRPRRWTKSKHPCEANWIGVECNDSRITQLKLPSMNLIGFLHEDIGKLIELEILDLSYNPDLTGPVPETIGYLKKLKNLVLAGCKFSGSIPSSLGNLTNLYFLALNSNNFTGNIPATLGHLSQLFWFDIGENSINGTLPVSTSTSPGLDQLTHTVHFHMMSNCLSGPIPSEIFHSSMKIKHFIADGNNLTGSIPSTVEEVKTLEILRLDRNSLSGDIPSELGFLPNLSALYLANNTLTGTIPNLNKTRLQYIDVSNNPFDEAEFPNWLKDLKKLTTLTMKNCGLIDSVPEDLFSIESLEEVKLGYNRLDGLLSISTYRNRLKLLDLRNNLISEVKHPSDGINHILILINNPVCDTNSSAEYCKEKLPPSFSPGSNSKELDYGNCERVEGKMSFRAPWFSDISNKTRFSILATKLCANLSLSNGSVEIVNVSRNGDNYMFVSVKISPNATNCSNSDENVRLASHLSGHEFWAPPEYGPYVFLASSRIPDFLESPFTKGLEMGLGIGLGAFVLLLVLGGIYVYHLRKEAKRNAKMIAPFASWNKEGSGMPEIKGAKWFSFKDMEKYTDNFSGTNEIGKGGYGKVYKGLLNTGQIVAIKRAKQGSLQGAKEFKSEIEFLSRVHHKNLVHLVGFCFDKGEQMLIYEFLSNGTLKDALSGKSGLRLGWKQRIQIALGSAQGLAYLHEHANPPIIHRDVKSANILLDEHLTAKVADFGLSLIADESSMDATTQIKGTLGYLDPEYCATLQLTVKSDVYSFGVVMLELLSSRCPLGRGRYLVSDVSKSFNPNLAFCGLEELIDPIIKDSNNLFGLEKFVDLALNCVDREGVNRPAMVDVVQELENILFQEKTECMELAPNSFRRSSFVHRRYSLDEIGDESADEISVVYNLPTFVIPK